MINTRVVREVQHMDAFSVAELHKLRIDAGVVQSVTMHAFPNGEGKARFESAKASAGERRLIFEFANSVADSLDAGVELAVLSLEDRQFVCLAAAVNALEILAELGSRGSLPPDAGPIG